MNKALKNNKGQELDPYTLGLVNGSFINKYPSINEVIKQRKISRHQALIDENLCPMPLQQGGMWINGLWESFAGLPPLKGEYGPKKGRKQRMRELAYKNK